MDNLLMEIQKSMHQKNSLSILNNGGFGYNSLHNYSINPSINSSINQPLLKNPNTNIMSPNFLRGSLPIISPPHFYSSSLPPNHHHHHHHNQPPLLPLPTRSSTPPSTHKKRKKKQQQQQQLKPNHSNITIPKPETKTEDIVKPITERTAKKEEEEEEDTEEEFLIVGSLSKTDVTSAYTSISPPPPSSVPMPRSLLKPKTNNVGSCNAEALGSAGAADDLRKLLRL